MLRIAVIISTFALSVVFASAILSVISYSREKKKLALYYSGFIFSFALIVMGNITRMYSLMIGISEMPIFKIFPWIVSLLGYVLVIIALPLVMYKILEINIKRKIIFVFFLLGGFLILEEIISFSSGYFDLLESIRLILLSLLFGFSVILTVRRKTSISRLEFREALKPFVVFLTIMIPLFLAEGLLFHFGIFEIPFRDYFFSKTLFAIILGISTIMYISYYFGTNKAKRDKLVEGNGFFKNHSISEREKEIILMLLEGKSYEDIANHLFTSPEIIEQSVYEVFKKTKVRNKLELIRRYKEYSQRGGSHAQ